MRKLLKEESTGFKIETGKINILVVFFVLTFEIFPQVPVNGFCRYQQFDVVPGFRNILPLNYNDDSYTDLILFNPADKKICAVDGYQNSTFGPSHIHKLQLQMSEIQALRDTNQNITGYAFISRKQSSAGIIKINNNGLPETESIIKFDSYPEDLSSADVNGDGVPELLVSGAAFNGLSLIYIENKLREQKIAAKTSYPEAVFVDLNNDGYPDIAAFEIFTNSLQYFYNNSKGEFKKIRDIPVSYPVSQLNALDMDIDSYSDLIISGNNEITIYYGDFASSYSDTVKINTDYYVDKFITGDFNRDGRIDIAYLNDVDGTLSIIFAKDNRKFYHELTYLQKDSLTDIIPYYSKFVNGITLLGESGKIYLVSNLTSFSDSVSIISGARPTILNYFDKDNNGINDLCFIDSYNQTLNLLIRNIWGIPDIWFPLPLFEAESDISVNNKNPQFKTFYCYTPGKKLIEVLNVDLKTNKFSRNSYYTAGKIIDLKIKRDNGEVFAAYLKDQNLGVTVFSADNDKYSGYSIKDIRQNVIAASLSIEGNPEVYFAASENNKIIIGEKYLEKNKSKPEINTGLKSDSNVILFAGNFLSKSASALYGFLNSEGKDNYVIFISPDSYIISGKKSVLPGFRIIDKNQLFFGELRLNTPGKVCYYDDKQHAVYSINISNRKINRDIIADHIFTRSFFIKNMNTQAYHLAYINNIENCITIKELK
ncbi:MAG TPA: VCBS repeat-containing protein [Ignavibacteriaceae bacterium]|nr:VCBS repeat-containing protein [Ignavibacteriaceae bacterium]